MITWRPPEVLLTFGGLEIRTYGVLLGLAILVGLVWANRRARHMGADPKLADDVFFWSTLGGIIGARLGFVIQDLPHYFTQPLTIFQVWQGGLSFHGALVGGILAGYLLLRHKHQLDQFWRLANVAAAPILLGASIGRLGNWANQELYGFPTSLPWAIAIDPVHRLLGYEQFTSFHPTFAYEAIINLLGLGILIGGIEKKPPRFLPRGYHWSFIFVIAWYGLARGITEIWRISDRVIGPLSLAQLVSIGMIIIAGFLYRQKLKIELKPNSLD